MGDESVFFEVSSCLSIRKRVVVTCPVWMMPFDINNYNVVDVSRV